MITPLKFLKELELYNTEKPYEMFGYPNWDSGKITNCEYGIIDDVNVDDVRGREEEFTLDGSGFKFWKHRSLCPLEAQYFEYAEKDGGNDVVASYLQEAMDLVKAETGAEKVFCFDWRFRRSQDPDQAMLPPSDMVAVRQKALPPGLTMHCDYSVDGGKERLEMHLTPEEYQSINDGHYRVRIINSWRPFNVVRNTSLVITDRRTVNQDELVEVDKVLPDKVEKGCYVKYRSYHRWLYLSNQAPEDVVLFVTWNSEQDHQISDFPPHGAAMKCSSADLPRESLEVRMITLTATGH